MALESFRSTMSVATGGSELFISRGAGLGVVEILIRDGEGEVLGQLQCCGGAAIVDAGVTVGFISC